MFVAFLAVAGCAARVEREAVRAEVTAAVASPSIASPTLEQSPVASPTINISPTSQPQSTGPIDQSGGGEASRPMAVAINLAGSAWAIVAVAALAAAVAILWLRAGRRLKVADAGIGAIGTAVADLGAGPVRDRLLALVENRLDLPARRYVDRVLGQRRVRVKRSHRHGSGP